MIMTPKHEKLISMSKTAYGAPVDLYFKEAQELRAAGLIVMKERFSAVGARKTRWFFLAS